MSSPDTTATDQDHPVSRSTVRRSKTPIRVVGAVLVALAIALASTACDPNAGSHGAIAKFWKGDVACAERIVKRESNFQPSAVNRSSGAIGLFQLHPTHRNWVKRTYGYDWAELKDPYKNAQVAAGLAQEANRYYRDHYQPWRFNGAVRPGGGCPA